MDADKPVVRTIPIADVATQAENANKGTERGRKLLKQSLKKHGAGRSVLLDKNFQALAGSKTIEEYRKQGKEIIVVDSDGTKLIAVRRTDLDAGDQSAQELAIADNRVNEVDLAWDTEILKTTEAELEEMFEPIELDRLLENGKNSRQPNTIDLQPPPKKMWILLGIPFNRFDLVQEHLAALEAEADISVQSARNE
jgi:hypothetical protein